VQKVRGVEAEIHSTQEHGKEKYTGESSWGLTPEEVHICGGRKKRRRPDIRVNELGTVEVKYP